MAAAARAGFRRLFSVSAFAAPPPPAARPAAEPCNNLFVSGLNKRTTSNGLKEAFSKFGQVIEARVITDRISGYSRGFGFVKYATVQEAGEAIKGMDGKFPDEYRIFLENTSKLPKSKALTVGLKVLAHSIESSLLHLLRKCDGITKLEIELIHHDAPKVSLCKLFRCPCVQQEMLRTDNVALDLLEVEFNFFTGYDEEIDLVKLLFMCKKTLKKMVINVADDVSLSEDVYKKIQMFSPPSTTLEMGGPSSHKRDVCQCKDHDWY